MSHGRIVSRGQKSVHLCGKTAFGDSKYDNVYDGQKYLMAPPRQILTMVHTNDLIIHLSIEKRNFEKINI